MERLNELFFLMFCDKDSKSVGGSVGKGDGSGDNGAVDMEKKKDGRWIAARFMIMMVMVIG